MQYRISGPSTAEVSLQEDDGNVTMTVGGWSVVTLQQDGTLKLHGGIRGTPDELVGLSPRDGFVRVVKEDA